MWASFSAKRVPREPEDMPGSPDAGVARVGAGVGWAGSPRHETEARNKGEDFACMRTVGGVSGVLRHAVGVPESVGDIRFRPVGLVGEIGVSRAASSSDVGVDA